MNARKSTPSTTMTGREILNEKTEVIDEIVQKRAYRAHNWAGIDKDDWYSIFWVYIMERIDEFDPEKSTIETWIWNLCEWKKGSVLKQEQKKYLRRIEEKDVDDYDVFDDCDYFKGIEDKSQMMEIRDILKEKLSEKRFLYLDYMVDFEGDNPHTYDQTAEHFGVNRTAVYTAIQKARKVAREVLMDYYGCEFKDREGIKYGKTKR